MVDNLIAASST